MNNFNLSNSTPKVLKHVNVYNKLYDMIKNGDFPLGSQLPSEPELAVMMDVSRMTLRRALALLQEDELVTLVRGKGNFVSKTSNIPSAASLARLRHPFYACCTEKSQDVEIEFRIELPTNSILESIGCDTSAIILADRWFIADEKAIGYSLSFVPIESMSRHRVDLNNTQELKLFLDEKVYSIASRSNTIFSHTNTGNFTASKYKLSEKDSFMLVQECLYEESGELLLFSKHYIPIDKFKIQISLSQ